MFNNSELILSHSSLLLGLNIVALVICFLNTLGNSVYDCNVKIQQQPK